MKSEVSLLGNGATRRTPTALRGARARMDANAIGGEGGAEAAPAGAGAEEAAAAPFAYVRVKHGRTTAFVEAVLGAPGSVLREAAATALGLDSASLQLLRRSGDGFVEVEDGRTLAEQQIACDGVVVGVLRGAKADLGALRL